MNTVITLVLFFAIYYLLGALFWYWMRANKDVDRKWKDLSTQYKGLLFVGWPIISISTFFFKMKEAFNKKPSRK
ncbi:hypothetical protein F9B85_00010 [Heliorestis acidaminivorans]|uniref:Uncharacterized protein n=1 Tax=Heliorestis acidaminivorans TaxID=553427 RepID=A0A6I0EZM4_9FIRM|nr:hypothetical protein [Heliorestis acidaminivorans]KAB2954126.1 hypothetical protein F9B85_00010 [Heliorestis acidaminivorans]